MIYKRLFLAIKLPEELKNEIQEYQSEFLNYPIFRWTPLQNLHLTVIFLGKIKEKDISIVSSAIKEAITPQTNISATVQIQQINYGPRLNNPRLVWADGIASDSLVQIRWQIITNLVKKDILISEITQKWLPHITIARIKRNFSLKLPPSIQIQKDIAFRFKVDKIWLIESILSPEGAIYKDLKNFSWHEKL